jgi:hypothetical protein
VAPRHGKEGDAFASKRFHERALQTAHLREYARSTAPGFASKGLSRTSAQRRRAYGLERRNRKAYLIIGAGCACTKLGVGSAITSQRSPVVRLPVFRSGRWRTSLSRRRTPRTPGRKTRTSSSLENHRSAVGSAGRLLHRCRCDFNRTSWRYNRKWLSSTPEPMTSRATPAPRRWK